MQGQSTFQGNEVVELNSETITLIPPEIIDNHSEIVIPFLTIISRMVRFGSATEITSVNTNNVMIPLKVVNATYKSRGFTIVVVAADNGYNALEHNPKFIELQITLNLTAED